MGDGRLYGTCVDLPMAACAPCAGLTPVGHVDHLLGTGSSHLGCVPLWSHLLPVRWHYVGRTGFEPAITGLKGQGVRPLHYRPMASHPSRYRDESHPWAQQSRRTRSVWDRTHFGPGVFTPDCGAGALALLRACHHRELNPSLWFFRPTLYQLSYSGLFTDIAIRVIASGLLTEKLKGASWHM